MKPLCICVCEREREKKNPTQFSSLLDLRYVGRDLTQHLGLGTPPEKEMSQDNKLEDGTVAGNFNLSNIRAS